MELRNQLPRSHPLTAPVHPPERVTGPPELHHSKGRYLIRRFNLKHNVDLSLDVGLHSGPLTTGVVRGERLSFDVWGQTINIARGIHDSPKRNVIQVTTPIVEALHGIYAFVALPPVVVKGEGELSIWELVSTSHRQEDSLDAMPEEVLF